MCPGRAMMVVSLPKPATSHSAPTYIICCAFFTFLTLGFLLALLLGVGGGSAPAAMMWWQTGAPGWKTCWQGRSWWGGRGGGGALQGGESLTEQNGQTIQNFDEQLASSMGVGSLWDVFIEQIWQQFVNAPHEQQLMTMWLNWHILEMKIEIYCGFALPPLISPQWKYFGKNFLPT